jgi:hypothetical protein
MSILGLPDELLSDIFNYVPLKDLINGRLINKFFKIFIKNNNWNHLISIYYGDDKILELLLDDWKFGNFRLEALNITDALVQKLIQKTWFVRFTYCTMAMKNIDILNQFHCYNSEKCFSLSNDNEIITKCNKINIISILTSKVCNETTIKRLKSFKPKRKACDKKGCDRKYCKFLKACDKKECDRKYCKYLKDESDITKNIIFHRKCFKNIFLSFFDEIVVEINEIIFEDGRAYKRFCVDIIVQRKCYEKLLIYGFATNNVINDNYHVDVMAKDRTYLELVDHLLFGTSGSFII